MNASKATSAGISEEGGSTKAAKSVAKDEFKPDAQTPQVTALASQSKQRYDPLTVDRSRVVQKPVSRTQADDPREFQIQQLRRRFSPKESVEDDGTAFAFHMAPSDPDFPFEMIGLECVLHVPKSYPRSGKPSLDVKNKEMGRGYQINVEKGFDALADRIPQMTLLGLMNGLDKQLEALLTGQKAETVKIVPNARKPTVQSPSVQPETGPHQTPNPVTKPAQVLPQTFTAEEQRQAAIRRDAETRQLEARLGRLPHYFKSSDGISYLLPIEPRKRADLPVPLQNVKTVRILIPMLYPLQPCRVEVQGVAKEAAMKTEQGFERKSRERPDLTLMAHVNYLTQNMHVLATEAAVDESPETVDTPAIKSLQLDVNSHVIPDKPPSSHPVSLLDDRSHIQFIPRPPEWAAQTQADHDDSDSESGEETSEDDYTDDSKSGVELEIVPEVSSTAPERGVLLSFPYLELYGIELLELISLSLTIKCERCKDQMDFKDLRSPTTAGPNAPGVKAESCKKCASALSVGYRKELMHVNSVRAGYLDLEGCTVVDMLPSNFIPTCAECSTAYAAPGVVSVRGESTAASCRECHHKMSFKIPEIKFLLVSAAARANQPPPRKKTKEKLGIVAGQELPRRGRCTHYSKSYRWFRFSCCSKVFPCDRCHDEQSDHPNEHANRMICGYCSREQNYRPEDCLVCHSILVGKKGSGFWEGGKGTRDKTKMSRKDPRKYKRRPG